MGDWRNRGYVGSIPSNAADIISIHFNKVRRG